MDIKTDINAKPKRWQDLGNIFLGTWLFFSPLVMDYVMDMPVAATNAYLLGMAIVVFAAVAIYIPRIWEEWTNMTLGVWLIISPWVLGFEAARDIMMNAVLVGVLVAALAAWAMTRDNDFKKWWSEHHAI